jgi:hypothetical protein
MKQMVLCGNLEKLTTGDLQLISSANSQLMPQLGLVTCDQQKEDSSCSSRRAGQGLA